MNIVQNDNGTIVSLKILDNDSKPLNLNGCKIEFAFVNKQRRFVKNATIQDAMGGVCQVKLTSEDLSDNGGYKIQATVTFPNNDEFSTGIMAFGVSKKI